MKNKPMYLATALMLAGLSVAGAKTHTITISDPARAGQIELAEGEYRVKVEGNNAIFTDIKSGKQVTVPVKIANSEAKHDRTAVQTTKNGEVNELKAIELGGSRETLQFGGSE